MITDNYIKMCERAEEIQKLWRKPFKNYIGDLYWKGKEYLIIREACGICEPEDDNIWLPTQEQLQEMILEFRVYKGLDIKCVIAEFYNFVYEVTLQNMNELWLAFVMKEKYNKIWNGIKWVAGGGIEE